MDLKMKNFPSAALRNGFSDDNYVYTENNEGEISKAVLEYMDFLNNDDLPLTSKQKEYNEYRKKQGYRLLIDASKRVTSPRTHSDEEEMAARYRVAMLLETAKGTLCAGFLEEHW